MMFEEAENAVVELQQQVIGLQAILQAVNENLVTKLDQLQQDMVDHVVEFTGHEHDHEHELEPEWTPRFPGDPAPGTILWGAAISGNGDPATRHEEVAGKVMDIRRTFFAWRHIDSGYLMNTVNYDHVTGRLPWVSVKTPDWAEVAAGQHDEVLDRMLMKLDGTGQPVWLTVWHEPENDLSSGRTAKAWRDMQVHVRDRMHIIGTTNVAFAGILMAWTFFEGSGRNPEDWWVNDVWDFIGIDNYMEKESVVVMSEDDTMWVRAKAFVDSKNIPMAYGEWGNRGEDAQAAAEMQGVYDYIIGDPHFVGACYFDSGLNSPSGSWELKGEPLNKFRELM